jgi:hypothetical protein
VAVFASTAAEARSYCVPLGQRLLAWRGSRTGARTIRYYGRLSIWRLRRLYYSAAAAGYYPPPAYYSPRGFTFSIPLG